MGPESQRKPEKNCRSKLSRVILSLKIFTLCQSEVFRPAHDDTDNKNGSDMINKLCAIKICKVLMRRFVNKEAFR